LRMHHVTRGSCRETSLHPAPWARAVSWNSRQPTAAPSIHGYGKETKFRSRFSVWVECAIALRVVRNRNRYV